MIEPDDGRLAVAKYFGATASVNIGDEKAVDAEMQLIGQRVADTAIKA